jgi:glycogen debranching enzyme
VDGVFASATLPSAEMDLRRLRSPDGHGLYASAGELYADAVFGRDSIEAAEDLLHLRPDIAREVILTLAHLQGTADVSPGPNSSEEERGRIHHEHRQLTLDGRRISRRSEELLSLLSQRWGGGGESMTYYGSVDATPLYVRLVSSFCKRYGTAILDEPMVDKDGLSSTIRASTLLALEWLERKMDESPLDLVEFRRRNPQGITFQVWKDSSTSFIHRDGELANWDHPIAAVEVQGYTFDALVGAAQMLGRDLGSEASRWRGKAYRLRTVVLEHFWMERDRYFAMGLDQDTQGRTRQVDSIASNGALLLDTGLFDGLPEAERYLRGVVERICGPEFLTDVGVRCRSLTEDGLVDFQDYQGTWTVWLKEGYDVAKGLGRQGFPRLAQQIFIRLLNGVAVARDHAEFLYVSPDQRVHYDFRGRSRTGPRPTEILGTNVPEHAQAWTVSAILAIKWRFGSRQAIDDPLPRTDHWRRELEDELLSRMPRARCLRTSPERQAVFDRRGDFTINLAAGIERDRAAREARRGHPGAASAF